MTSPVAVLAAPIRAVLDGVGAGAMTASPARALRAEADVIERAEQNIDQASADLAVHWRSTAADAARTQVRGHRQQLAALSGDARRLADVVDDAVRTVADAARELRGVLDSFVSAADAMGPGVYTPAGIATLIPLAAAHLNRAIAIAARTRARLDQLTTDAAQVGRHRAPGIPHVVAPPGQSAVAAPATFAHASTPSPGSSTSSTAITLPDGSVVHAPTSRSAIAVRAALSQVGVPYAWGGTTPGRGFDCSGLTQYAYRQAGVQLPRLAQDQDTAGYRVDRAQAQPGDLAVWSGHVAMVVGDGKMVEAGDPVGVTPIRTTNGGQTFEGFYRPR